MNEFKFQLSTFALVALLAFGAYWAFTNLDRGVSYQRDDVVAVPDQPQAEEGEEDVIDPVVVQEFEPEEPVEEEPESPDSLSEEETLLRDELQDLITDDIYMREGSRGTRVGTVQRFLNLYLETESSVDNQYGPGTRERVRKFQEEEGLMADGLAGPSTYGQMIDVLESGQF